MIELIGIVILAFVPSLVWLIFFCRQDKHPEPKRVIMRIFLWGVLIAIPIVVIEGLLGEFVSPLFNTSMLWMYQFLGIALVEEVGKYGVVRFKALTLPAFDEPQDAIIYMITAALGFAAIENMAYALSIHEQGLGASLYAIGGRFLTANLLHIIASGFVGYAIARTYFSTKHKKYLIFYGLVVATLLHGLYNHFIIQDRTTQILALPVVSLLILVGGGIAIITIYRRMR